MIISMSGAFLYELKEDEVGYTVQGIWFMQRIGITSGVVYDYI